MNRREFLAASGALSVARRTPQSRARSGQPGYGPWLTVDRSRLTWNVGQIARRVEGRPILAVVKANAYGHGLVGAGKHLESLPGVYGLAVFKVEEALELRESGVEKPVLVLGPCSDAQLELLVQARIMPSIYADRGQLLSRLAARYKRPVKIHLYVDTGLGRMGVQHFRALPLIEALSVHKAVEFDGVLTPLTEDEDFDREQLRRLVGLCERARSRGVSLGRRHAASSAGVFHFPAAWLDMVRPGISLYGCYPDSRSQKARTLELRPALSLRTRVMQVKRLRKGDSLQYHRAYVAEKPVWIATLPIGYSDGWLRQAAGTCTAWAGGGSYPLVAAVTSNHTLIELGEERTVKEGDEVLLFGAAGGHEIDPHGVASRTGTSAYSLLIQMNPLLRREFL